MISIDNLKEVKEDNTNNYDIVTLTNKSLEFDDEELYDLSSDKDFKKYIFDIEKDVRGSWEYKRFIQFLRNNMDMNKCSFLPYVSNVDSTKIRIEIHHSPFTLWDICIIIFNKRKYYYEDLRVQSVAKEVAMCHYNLLVGLIPLSETIHQLVHNGFLFIPADLVMGRYGLFVEYYKEFISTELLDSLEEIEAYSRVYNETIFNKEILSQKSVIINPNNIYTLPSMEDISIAMKNRIAEIKDNYYSLPDHSKKQTKCPIRFVNCPVHIIL